MPQSLTPRQRRATRRTARKTLRQRTALNRLAASCRRRPRSLASHLIATGTDPVTAGGAANGLRSVAKRLGVTPARIARTRRTVNGGRSRKTRTVYRYTLAQLVLLVASYAPRKVEFKAAVARFTLATAGLAVAL
ncbi:hypothetical protein ACIOML_29090 [Streptomyces anulatus]